MLAGFMALAVASTKLCGVAGPPLLPADRAISNAQQASDRAYVAAVKVYGRQSIHGEKPLKAVRSGSVWKVEGTLPPNYLGGVVEVTLAARDGAIVDICHGK